MSDARTDFFSSAGKSKPLPSRDDFFAGNVDLDEVGKKSDKREEARDFSKPYAYFTPEVQRDVGNTGRGLHPLAEVPAGINQGVAHLLGLPVDTLVSAANLASAGMGYAQSKITGGAPSPAFDPLDPASVPLSGAWNEQALNSVIGQDVTSTRDPTDPVSRVFHAATSGVPGGVVGGGPVLPNALSGLAGGAAGAVLNEAGADPATQAVGSLLAGYGASRIPTDLPPETPVDTTQEKLNAAASKQSMGAAGAAVDLQKLSPDLRAAVTKAVNETGGAVNPDAMARHIQADSLPVKVNLSEGQVLGDPRIISNERNARGKTPGFVEGFAAQNKALVDNLRVFRDTAGDNVFSTNPAEHADTLIERYQKIDEARNADIGQKYQELRDAAGGAFPVDTQTLLSNVKTALKKDLATSKAPSDVMSALEEHASSGSMTLEDFEGLRTSLARTQRSAADGQERHAAGVIRNQIEAMPLQAGAEQLKGLADSARAAARERFQALEADPAYKAAVNETVSPDKFVQKFVIGGDRDNVAKLSQAMAGDDAAAQTVKVATLDHLRQAAGVDQGFNGNFSQAGYNKALRNLTPKLGYLLDPKLAEHVQNLGDVARYTQLQPEGHFVNNSNTFVAAAAEHAGDILEGAANVKAGGIPVGTWVRQNVTDRSGRKAAAKTFAPGAGLTRLSDLAKLKEPK